MSPPAQLVNLPERPGDGPRPRVASQDLADERRYRPDLDGLRALAILSVVLYHAGIPGLDGGFTGVDIFFVISGYLIGGHIFAEARAGEFSYLRFYQRRARRILPAFLAMMTVVLAVGLVLLSPLELDRLGREGFAATLSASNVLFWHGANYFDPRSELHPLLMTWSLGVEEQFYAIIPFLMVLVARLRREWALLAIVSVCVLSFLVSWGTLQFFPTFDFYMLPSRAWELGIGVALAVAEAGRRAGLLTPAWARIAAPVALILTIAPVFLLPPHAAFPGPAALPSVLGAALAIACRGSWVNDRLLAFRPLVFVGRISYSWYLWHWPLLAFAAILYGGGQPRAVSLGAVCVAFVLAVGSYYFVEQPCRRSTRAAAPLLWRYALLCAATLAVWAGVWVGHGVPSRHPELARVEFADPPAGSDPCLAEDSDQPDRSSSCVDAGDARPAVALWGDSHAAALAPGLRELAHAQGYSLMELGKASCAPLTGAAHFVPRTPLLAASCFRYNRSVLALLSADRRVRVVVLSAGWAGYLYRSWQGGWLTADLEHQREIPSVEGAEALFTRSLVATVALLESAGKLVMVADDNPAFDFEPLWKMRTAAIPLRRTLARWMNIPDSGDAGFAPAGNPRGAETASALVRAALATRPDAKLIDLKAPFRTAGGEYLYRDGDRLLFTDNNHLSRAGARFALREVRLPPPAASVAPEKGR